MPRSSDHLTITLNWDATRKRWRATWVLQLEKGVAHHWRWIETREPIDVMGASMLIDAVEAEMRAWLPFSDIYPDA